MPPMADRTPNTAPPRDRLQPALLDRLTDEEPEKRTETGESRAMTRQRFRLGVLRDLAWLFNTTRLESGSSLAKMPYAQRSVINFGLPALSGRTATTLDVTELARAIKQAILDFEPRILPSSLEVRTLIDEAGMLDHHNVVGVEIEGQLWAHPVPIDLLVRTEIDLETGRVEIADLVPQRVA
jgi:type VI secretion system protein ImpF